MSKLTEYYKMNLKKLICLLAIIINVTTLVSSQNNNNNNRVVITGVLENPNWMKKNFVGITINRPGIGQLGKKAKFDQKGNFKFEFNLSTPTDLWFDYRMNFLIAVHPGDSIHVILDGAKKDRPPLLKSIKFSGTASKLNQDIAVVQQLYYDSPLYIYTDKKRHEREIEIIKSSSPEQYSEYLSKQKEEIYNSFIRICHPCKEARMWGEIFLTTHVLNKKTKYPKMHKHYNNLSEMELPLDYYDGFVDLLPLTDSMLICGYCIDKYVDNYEAYYVSHQIFNDVKGKTFPFTPNNPTSKDIQDSLYVHGIIKYTPDTLLRQMVLAEFFLEELGSASVIVYEKYLDVIDRYVKLPYLSKTLSKYYEGAKKNLNNPSLASELILNESLNSTISGIMDAILINHKNEIIYIDCWATWCGPCLSEMPNSKKIMEELNGKDVAFVYFCIESEEKKWKAMLDKYQLKGEHYLLSKTQSDDLRRIFEIEGIPRYIMIDRNGKILGKDYNLRPDAAKTAIDKLLKK